MHASPRRLAAAILLAGSLSVAGCGGGDGGDNTADIPSGDEPAAQVTTTAPEPEKPSGPSKPLPPTSGEKKLGKKPPIDKPKGDPPAELVKRDIVKGKGAVAKDGSKLRMQYVGISFSTGEEFDASWDRGEPFEFTLGEGSVIPGWDEGIKGMREGGRRQLVIPPDLAYGAQGQPPDIGPNETLVFDVDLLKVE